MIKEFLSIMHILMYLLYSSMRNRLLWHMAGLCGVLYGDCMGSNHLQHNYHTKQPETDACIALPALSSAMVCVQVWPLVW